MKRLLILLALMPLMASTCSKDPQVKPEKERTLTVSPSGDISAPAEGCSVTLKLSTDGDWAASADQAWVSLSKKNGVSNADVTVTVAPNENYEPRDGRITFQYGTGRLSLSVSQQAAPKPEVDPSITVPDGYHLVWHDEFLEEEIPANGNDCLVNTASWKFENWAPGWVNNELQRYVPYGVKDGVHTAWVEDGILNISAIKHNGEVISARMNSRESWKYGYMEASIWLPKGKGTWPAFWMMPDDQSLGWPACGEVDIMEEVGVHANYTSSSIHCRKYNHVQNTQKTKEIFTEGAEDGFHTYACEWTPEGIKFFTDGKQFFEFKNDGLNSVDSWPFNKPFYITLNLAWGGDWGGYAGVDEKALPTTMKVDYVRVFQKD